MPKKKPQLHIKLGVKEWTKKIDAERVKADLCRHCGGPVPCWSYFGDIRPGVRKPRKDF